VNYLIEALIVPFSIAYSVERTAWDLSSVSWYSFSGIESITIPAPDCVNAFSYLEKIDFFVWANQHNCLKKKKPMEQQHGPLV